MKAKGSVSIRVSGGRLIHLRLRQCAGSCGQLRPMRDFKKTRGTRRRLCHWCYADKEARRRFKVLEGCRRD